MKTRQEKANEIRDLIKQVNARTAELQEEGCTVSFNTVDERMYRTGIDGIINSVTIERVSKL